VSTPHWLAEIRQISITKAAKIRRKPLFRLKMEATKKVLFLSIDFSFFCKNGE
jgi:hypothetical protein